MNAGPPRRRRARPVADAPIDALIVRTEDLAKGWLLAILEEAALASSPDILAGRLPSEGPTICAAVVRSLASDGELRKLEPGGELEPLIGQIAGIVGARELSDATRAIDALSAVIWAAVREELVHPGPDQISELAERLGLAIELIRMATVRSDRGGMAEAAPAADRQSASEPALAAEPVAAEEPEREPAAEPDAVRAPRDPGALWLTALDDEIARATRAGAHLSLLLADLDDAERVLAVEPDGEASATFGRFAQAVRSVVRRQDILACETDTRAWIIARDTARAGAQALGARIAEAVGEAGNWRGAPLRVSVGLAVLGEDARDSAGLITAAEEASFLAAASGIDIVRATPGAASEESGPRLVS